MTSQDAEYAFDDMKFEDYEGKRKRTKTRKKDKPARAERKHRKLKRLSDHPPREDARVIAKEGDAVYRGKEIRRRNRSVRELERLRAPSNSIRYPDCPVNGKRSYGSPAAAADAIETIRRVKDGTYYPTRAYRCPDCDYWHMTSKDFQSELPDPEVPSPVDRKPVGMHDPSELVKRDMRRAG